MSLGQEIKTWSFGPYAEKFRGKFLAKTMQTERFSEGIILLYDKSAFFCLESGVEQSCFARYKKILAGTVYMDKQGVITQRFRNRTVRNDEIGLLFQNAASINCYSSECKDMVISGHTHRLLR